MSLFNLVKSRSKSSDWTLDFSSDDLLGAGAGTSQFLSKFREAEIMALLTSSGVIPHAASKGYDSFNVRFDLSDPFVHSLFLDARHVATDNVYMLMEVHLRVICNAGELKLSTTASDLTPGQLFFLNSVQHLDHLRLLACEFLRLQNPAIPFSASRPPLPGQDHPGLGCMRQAGDFLVDLAGSHSCDGILNAPQHFQNAFLYARNGFEYANAEVQGGFDTMVADLKGDLERHGLAPVANAVLQGRLFMHRKLEVNGKKEEQRVIWAPEEQIFPISDRLKAYLKSNPYERIRKCCVAKGVFFIDWDCPLASDDDIKEAQVLRHAIVDALDVGEKIKKVAEEEEKKRKH